jgi:N-acetylmuramoyl-L-alanine amidase
MRPYVIRRGEYLVQLANQFGFDAETVWGDDKNADLREQRSDPNILAPGDVMYIPDRNPRDQQPKTVFPGTTNTFVSDPAKTTIKIQFLDTQLASHACTIAELPDLAGLATDANGVLTFPVPVTLEAATITFPDASVECFCRIGHLDPITTLSGAHQRLQNLGYIDDRVSVETANADAVRLACHLLLPGKDGQDPGSQGPAATAASSSADVSPTPMQATPGSTPSTPDAPLEGVNDEVTSKRLRDAHGC